MRLLICLFLVSIGTGAVAQKQLLLLKKGKIMHRFHPGDGIYVKVKDNPDRIHSYINNIFEDAVVLQNDTIPFHTIERTYLDESNLANVFGGLLVTAGALYFVIDQANEVRQGNGLNINKDVAIGSGLCIGVGLPLMLAHKKSQKLGGYKYRLLMVKQGDPMYR